MTTLIRLAVRLYPACWRRRYGREFDALLADLSPGWRDLIDVTLGALTMRLHSLVSIPAGCAIAGALIGTVVAVQSPTLYASSATLSLSPAPDTSKVRDLRVPVESALTTAGGRVGATSVMLLHGNDGGTLVQVTYADADPSRARGVADGLAQAIVRAEEARSPKVIAAAALPVAPLSPPYASRVGGGAIAGMVIGAAALATLRVRRRRS